MGRHRRFETGSRRTISLRQDQADALDHLADGLGLDVSHVVRAHLDWSYLRGRTYRWYQFRAALEISWRRLTPPVAAVVLARWNAKRPNIDLTVRASALQLSTARRVVEIMRTLVSATGLPNTIRDRPPPPWTPSPPGSEHVSDDWATTAPEPLLAVLGSPWVVVIGSAEGRPTTFLAAADVIDDTAKGLQAPNEEGVMEVARHLTELGKSGRVKRWREKEPTSGDAPPAWGWYEIKWPKDEAAALPR
jgi:hypothetical protein